MVPLPAAYKPVGKLSGYFEKEMIKSNKQVRWRIRSAPNLSVNVDHIATLRQARKGKEPDPIAAAVIAELAGANGIIAHLREDRRHIQDRDLRLLREIVQSKLNMEMAATEEMLRVALQVKPDFSQPQC